MGDRVPINAAAIGQAFGYDQVIILARRVGEDGQVSVTTWGKNPEHCSYAARIGDALRDDVTPTLERQAARIAELETAGLGQILTNDELTWLAARAGVIDHEAISARPRPDELTAEGLLTLRVKLTAALENGHVQH